MHHLVYGFSIQRNNDTEISVVCLHFLIRSERWEGNSRKLNIREPWLNMWVECGLVRMHRGHRLNAHEKHATTSNIVIWFNTTQENHAAVLRADSRKTITSNQLKRGNKIYLLPCNVTCNSFQHEKNMQPARGN